VCEFEKILEDGSTYSCPVPCPSAMCFFHEKIDGKLIDENKAKLARKHDIKFAYLKNAKIEKEYSEADIEKIKEIIQDK